MKLLESKFFKDWCVFLAEQDSRYFILYGKIGQIEIESRTDYDSRILSHESTAFVKIPFINKDNKLYTLLNIYNKEEYHTIVEILEDIL